MNELTNLICDVCGGELTKLSESEYQCKCCKTRMRFSENYIADLADFRIALSYRTAYDFERAETQYRAILKNNASSSEAWFGLLLSEYGIEFTRNDNSDLVPIFHNVRRTGIFESESYLKAIECADEMQKGEYRRLVELAESVRLRIMEAIEQKSAKYDIFLCQKINRADGSGRTKEYEFALRLMRLLEKRYGENRVFLSEISLGGGVDSDAEIFSALYGAKAMIVLSSSESNANSTWVKSEWTRYAGMIDEGFKKRGSLIPISMADSESAFPNRLKKLQCLMIGDPEYMNVLYEKLDEVLSGSMGGEKLYVEAEKCFSFGEYEKTSALCDSVLEREFDNHNAHWLKLLAMNGCANSDELVARHMDISKNIHYQNAVKFAPLIIANERIAVSNRIFRELAAEETARRQRIIDERNKMQAASTSFSGLTGESSSAPIGENTSGDDASKPTVKSVATKFGRSVSNWFSDVVAGIDNAFSAMVISGNTLCRLNKVESGIYVVPENVTKIADDALTHAKNLQIIKIHKKVTEIAFGVFTKCPTLQRIEVEDGNPVYRSIDGLLYAGSVLLCCPTARGGKVFIVGGTTAIEQNAFFNCRNLNRVTIPDSIRYIDRRAFMKCGKLDKETQRRIKSIVTRNQQSSAVKR